MPYKVVMTWEATIDVFNIAKYIEKKFGRPRADLFQADIKEQMSTLGTSPKIFSKTGILYRGYEIRKKPFSPSIIFYVSIDSKEEVHVLRVLREESNWSRTLKQTPYYTYPK